MGNGDHAIYTVVVPLFSAISVIGIASFAGTFHIVAHFRPSFSHECARERVVDGPASAEDPPGNQVVQQTALFGVLGVLRVDTIDAIVVRFET